jgi:hypothetical protein
MTLCRSMIRCQIEEWHEISVYVHVMRYLESRVGMAKT